MNTETKKEIITIKTLTFFDISLNLVNISPASPKYDNIIIVRIIALVISKPLKSLNGLRKLSE